MPTDTAATLTPPQWLTIADLAGYMQISIRTYARTILREGFLSC